MLGALSPARASARSRRPLASAPSRAPAARRLLRGARAAAPRAALGLAMLLSLAGSAATPANAEPTQPSAERAGAAQTSPLEHALASAAATAPSQLAPPEPASVAGETLAPSLLDGGEELVSSGALETTTVSKIGPPGFALDTAEGEREVTLLDSRAGEQPPAIVDGAAALFSSAGGDSQLIVRPTPLGDAATVVLDGASSPRTLDWEVQLAPGERLAKLADGAVALLAARAGQPWPSSTAEASGLLPSLAHSDLLAPAQDDPSAQGATPEPATSETVAPEPAAPLPPAPALTAPPASAASGEPEPQQTAGEYELEASELASAEAETGDAALLSIAPDPSEGVVPAIDTRLTVRGNRLIVSVSPPAGATYPLGVGLQVSAAGDAASAERHLPAYGIADDRPSAFGAAFPPQLSEGPLHVQVARLVLPYDAALTGGPELTRLREWLHAIGEARSARRIDLQPYVTLWSQECLDADGTDCPAPPPARYREAVYALMSEFGNGDPAEGLPAVRMWGAWNEPNDSPANLTASAAAQLWQTASSVASLLRCGCEVAAAEFAGFPARYAVEYKAYMLEHGLRPAVWGMHDYGDLIEVPSASEAPLASYVNRRERGLLELTATRLGKPQVWLSEQGVELENPGAVTRLAGDAELQTLAAEDFLRLGAESTRVALVDYYMLQGPEAFTEAGTGIVRAHPEAEGVPVFGSSLLSEAGAPLPAFCVLAYEAHVCPS